mgnify:CR=1 FL=1
MLVTACGHISMKSVAVLMIVTPPLKRHVLIFGDTQSDMMIVINSLQLLMALLRMLLLSHVLAACASSNTSTSYFNERCPLIEDDVG